MPGQGFSPPAPNFLDDGASACSFRCGQAAAQATQAAEAVMASAHEARRIEALSRFIQKPDMYRPDREQEIDQWVDWRHVMRNYLGVIDSNYLVEMDLVEAATHEEAGLDAARHPDAARRSRELYAILASFMRGRPLKILRNVPSSNGYEAWRQLMLEMQPRTRQRQLALMTQLRKMTFDMKKSLNEQLGKFDEVVREYERISGSTYPEDLKVSTLVNAAPGPLQVQLQRSLRADTTYNELKEKVLAYERSTTKWQAASGLQFPAVAANDTATPMEIDAVSYAGGKKGKKGDEKGKKGKGKDRDSKGRPKGGKPKGGKPEPKKGGRPTGKCHTCGKQGHFSRDCWHNRPGGKGVHQVQEETSSSPSSTATTVAAPTQQPVHPAAKAVRRIKLSTPPTAATTEIFDISEDTVAEFALEPADPYFVQMVTATTDEDPPVEEDEPALIILDSGADASMVPYSFGGRGSPAGGSPPVLQDAQGNKIDGGTHRKFDFWFEAADGKRFAVREQCVVGNVQVPLLAVGKLLRRGWQIINDGELKLQEPFGRAAKVAFRHNSLALRGHIRAVTLSTPSPAAVPALTDHPRTLPAAPPVIPLPDYLKEIVGREGMHELPHGIKGHYAPEAFKLMDGRMWYDADVFSARTTLVKKANGSWIQIENSSDYAYEASPFGPIANRGCERITLFRMESFGEGFFEGRGMAPKASTRFAAESEDEPTPEQPKQPETPKPDEPEETEHAMETDEGDYLEELAAGKAVEKAKQVFERAPRPVTEPPAVPSEAEVKAHRLTHIPYARWCSTCVKTRARGDKHGSRKDVDRTPMVQVDFFFTTVDPDGRPEEEELPEHPCSLVGIDGDTRMVLAVPGPNKGGIALHEALCGGASSLYHCPPRRGAHCATIGRRAVHQGGGSRDSRGQSKPRAEDDPEDHANRGPSSQRRRRKGSADGEAFGQHPGGGH